MDTQEGSFERVIAALEKEVGPGRQAGSWMRFCCPVHEVGGNHKPSLGVKYLADVHRTKVQCYAGCHDEEILAKVGLQVRDLYDAPITHRQGGSPRPTPRIQPRRVTRAERAIDAAGLPLSKPKADLGKQLSSWRTITAYPYMLPDGTVAGEVVRREAKFEHGREKRFYQHHWDAETGQMADGGFEPLPFQLPRVLDAVARGEAIYVCEGEKDVLSAEAAGLTATTNVGGALAWRPEHARWLDGAAEVIVVADRDAPGYRRADNVLSTLTGRVGSVRVVQAATGKDLTDHLSAGHSIDELEPVPYLDPSTGPGAARPAPATAEHVAESAGVVSVAPVPAPDPTQLTHPNLDGGSPMGEISGLGMSEPVHHDDTVDTISGGFAKYMQQLMNQLLIFAQMAADRRRQAAEEMERQSEQARREYEQRKADEQKAVEVRLAKMAKTGWDRASRSEIAAAVRDAATWASDSDTAKRALNELSGHVRNRWGVHIDTATGHVTVDASPQLAAKLAATELNRAANNRIRTAQDRMVSMVAGEAGLDESKKAPLYADIADWSKNPSGHSLTALSKKLESAGVGERTRTKIRFVAVYLGTPQMDEAPLDKLGTVALVSPVTELRRLDVSIADAGEECKPRVDEMLVKYQDWTRTGRDTHELTKQLGKAIAVMTPEDQKIARDRGVEIRKSPSGVFKPLWPDHIDRDELTEKLRMYAALQPQVDARIVQDDGTDADWANAQRDRATKLRREIDTAIKTGEGLHELEVDQIKAVLADVEAGKTTIPEVLFADDRSAAVHDRNRTDETARGVAGEHRRKIEEILSSSAAPDDAARIARDDIANVVVAQASLASGRTTLGDYEETGVDARLIAKLSAAGVPEPLRNRVRHELDRTVSDSAITGKQARRMQDRWVDKRELVAASRAPATPVSYDSPERRNATEAGLRAAGLSDRAVRGRMAADAGHATPPSSAVNGKPSGQTRARRTAPGSGVYRTNHRGRPGDQRGYGK